MFKFPHQGYGIEFQDLLITTAFEALDKSYNLTHIDSLFFENYFIKTFNF